MLTLSSGARLCQMSSLLLLAALCISTSTAHASSNSTQLSARRSLMGVCDKCNIPLCKGGCKCDNNCNCRLGLGECRIGLISSWDDKEADMCTHVCLLGHVHRSAHVYMKKHSLHSSDHILPLSLHNCVLTHILSALHMAHPATTSVW